MNKLILGLFVLGFSVNSAFSVPLSVQQKRYDAILSDRVGVNEPGVAVIVSKNGNVLYKGARGLANLEHNIPLTTDSVFRLGSITKQFTAVAIMMLHEQKKLSLDDDIHKYIADFPTDGNKVTIENLLTHTSGIANYTEDRALMMEESKLPTTVDEMLSRFAKHPMRFKTGEKMRYSNTGYVLLGKIIEVASGQSYASFIDENIFKRIGMHSSLYGGAHIINKRAYGYDYHHPQGIKNAEYIDMTWPYAAGSLLSTVIDINKWFTSLHSGQLIAKESYQRMIKPFILNDGSTSNYGYGLGIRKIGKYDAIGHGGGIPGFATDAFYVPSEDLYIAVFRNLSNSNPSLISGLLAVESLDIPWPEFKPLKSGQYVKLNQFKNKSILGKYKTDDRSMVTLSMEAGKIYFHGDGWQKFEIVRMSENSFYFKKSLSYIVIESNGKGEKVMSLYRNLSETPVQATKTE